MRDESGEQFQLPQIIHSPKQSISKRDDFNISYSQGKVSFGTKKQRGLSEDPTSTMKNIPLEKIYTTTKEEKIRQILMNEDPDFATAEKELNFLSNIAEVRSLGFDRFRYQIINKNNNSSMNVVNG